MMLARGVDAALAAWWLLLRLLRATLLRPLDRLAQWLVRTCVLTQTVPAHVAFVMDGNRRFATAAGLPPCEGHGAGATTLVAALEWCLTLGVRVVSVYAFSLENFKRSPQEVRAAKPTSDRVPARVGTVHAGAGATTVHGEPPYTPIHL